MSQEFFNAIPKAEFHLHIEGAIPFYLLQKLDSEKYKYSPESWKPNYTFKNFEDFDAKLLDTVMPWYNSPERYNLAAKEIFEILQKQNVEYVEVSFASGIVQFLDIAGDEIAEAIAKAVPKNMTVKVFFGIHHNGKPQKMDKIFESALNWKHLDGVDLHGNEALPIEDWTKPYWQAMRNNGKHTKAHAGEFGGADSVRFAVEELGVKQIQHGVRAIEDESLIQDLIKNKIVLDVAPTSNIKLGVYKNFDSHPLKKLLRCGVECTLNTDDPIIFGNTLTDEYINLIDNMGFTLEDAAALAKSGWKHAKVDASVKQNAMLRIENLKEKFKNHG